MKRLLIVAVVLLSVGLSSCQCAEKPDIGPVEGEEAQAQRGDASSGSDLLSA